MGLYLGIPYVSLWPHKETKSSFRKLEKIYFFEPFGLPIFLKKIVFNLNKPFTKKVVEAINDHPELYTDGDLVFIKESDECLGEIPVIYNTVIKRSLIDISVVKTDEEKKAIIAFDYKNRRWVGILDSGVYEIDLKDYITKYDEYSKALMKKQGDKSNQGGEITQPRLKCGVTQARNLLVIFIQKLLRNEFGDSNEGCIYLSERFKYA